MNDDPVNDGAATCRFTAECTNDGTGEFHIGRGEWRPICTWHRTHGAGRSYRTRDLPAENTT